MGVVGWFEDLEWWHYAIAGGALLAIIVATFAACLTRRNRRRKEIVTWNDVAALEAKARGSEAGTVRTANTSTADLYQEQYVEQPPSVTFAAPPAAADAPAAHASNAPAGNEPPPPLPIAETSTYGNAALEIL